MKIRNTWMVLLIALILGAFVIGGGYAGYREYMSLRQAHLIKQAQYYVITKPNAKKALLCLHRVLRSNPRNVEACRLMAELSEASSSPGALIWRNRVVELNPHSLDDRLALARCAMMFRDYASATNALDGVDAVGKQTAAFHNIAGALAAAVNQFALAEAHFLEAARLEPTNPAPQLNLAVVRLHSTNALEMAEARAALTRISFSNPAFRCQALRELVVDSIRSKQTNTALALSKELAEQTNSAFSDRLLRLDVLQGSRNAEFKSALAAFQREAATNNAKIYELSMWQMAKIGPAETLAWLRSLPANSQTNQPVALLAAECQMTLGDWRGLQNSLKQQDWAELESIRHAFQSRALRGQDLTGAAKAEWDLAVETANGQKGNLIMLLRLAAQWGREGDSEELLWAIVNRYPEERWAEQTLGNALFADGSTRALLQLFTVEYQRHPSSLTIKNNLAMIALLLDAQELNPHELAREVYEMSPTNANYASTYAFSLYLQKKPAEALKILRQISPKELEDPPIAGYYAMVLEANGNHEKAGVYFTLSAKARLLPEEHKFIDKANAAN